jgi:hypothetical protein
MNVTVDAGGIGGADLDLGRLIWRSSWAITSVREWTLRQAAQPISESALGLDSQHLRQPGQLTRAASERDRIQCQVKKSSASGCRSRLPHLCDRTRPGHGEPSSGVSLSRSDHRCRRATRGTGKGKDAT